MLKKYGSLMFLGIFLLGSVLLTFVQTYRWNGDKKAFQEAEIRGRISSVNSSTSGTHFKVKGNRQKFHFPGQKNENVPVFRLAAQPGDSISKDAMSDTLFLWKEGRSFSYLLNYEEMKMAF